MKKVAKGIQRLGQRAAQVAQAVEAMPAKAAALRESVATTLGQAQQLRADLVSGAATLSPRTGSELAGSLREIEDAADVLAQAGYELAGVEVEPGIGGMGSRQLVLLARVDEVGVAELRSLLVTHKDRPALKSVLSALVQATETAAGIEFATLDFTEVLIDVGAGRAARIGWRAEIAAPVATILPTTASVEPRPPAFSQSNFFSRPATAVAASSATATTTATTIPSATEPSSPASVAAKSPDVSTVGPASRASALDRFKKMPDLSKRPRG